MQPIQRGTLYFEPEPTLYFQLLKKTEDRWVWVGDFDTRQEAAVAGEPFLVEGIDCTIRPKCMQ